MRLTQSGNSTLLADGEFSGVVRIAYLPNPRCEVVLDRVSSCYPVYGEATFARPFCL